MSSAAMASPSQRKIPNSRKTCSKTSADPTLPEKTSDLGTSTSVPVHPKKVLVPIGLGTEEMEAVIVVDVLQVIVASVEPNLEIEGAAVTRLVADTSISSCSDHVFDLVALPGGMPGSARLRDCEILRKITSKQAEDKRLYGAICAAPAVILLPWGLLTRKQERLQLAVVLELLSTLLYAWSSWGACCQRSCRIFADLHCG